MTERISHRDALRAVNSDGEEETVRRYVTQQQALEADTVSRAEHEAEVERLEKVVGAREAYHEAQLTALQAELEQVNNVLAGVDRDTEPTPSESVQKLVLELLTRENQLATERARAEEAERQVDAWERRAARLMEEADAEVVEANARVARLEEQLAALQQEMGLHVEPAQPAPGGTERKRHTVDCGGFDKDCECNPWKPSPTPAEPQGHWSDCSDCVRDGGHCKRHPAGHPPVDYVTYEVLIEALNDYDNDGLARHLLDRLEKARRR